MKEITLGVVLFVAITTGLAFYQYAGFKFFAPKYAEVRNETFHNTQAFNDGMANDLADLRIQYLGAKPEQKDAIRAIVLQRFASYPKDRLPAELRDFYFSL